MLTLLLLCLGIGLAARPTAASFDVKWAQSNESLELAFVPTEYEYPAFSYKAVLTPPGSVLRVWFMNDTDTKFMRLHLGGLVNTTSIAAEAIEGGGAKLVLPKVSPGFWNSVVLSTTDRPVSAVYNFEAAAGQEPISLRVFEYETDVKQSISQAITQVEGRLELTGDDIDNIANTLSNSIALATPVCHLDGFCTCTLPFVFDGLECVNGRPFAAPERHIRSQSLLNNRVFLNASELLEVPLANVSAAFSEYQEAILKAPRFPHTIYAQLFAGSASRVAVVGAGLEFFEAFVFGGLGARLTVIDGAAANLKLVERFAEEGVPQFANAETVVYTGLESLGNLTERGFDAVVALDSLTHAPKEHTAPLFAKLGKLVRPGGRFLLLAPSRHLYNEMKRPRFDVLDPMFKFKDSYPVPTWSEWMDRNKLLKLLEPSGTSWKVVMNAQVGSFPPLVQNDVYVWLDLMALS
ncbi:methyltransferase domain-containing protein [Pseudoscourfieldia marina]